MLELKTLTLAELTRSSHQWDDLWLRSKSVLPSQRCRGLQLWCQSFAPKADLVAIVVECDGRWIAGLPLIRERTRWPLTVYRLPSNHTVSAGDLLIDPDCDATAVTRVVARQIAGLPGAVAKFEGIPIDAERWKHLIAALELEGRAMHLSPGHEVGVVDILHDWNAYTRSWSANHRSSLKRARNKLEAEGQVAFERLRNPSESELHDLLEICFAIEDKGWKGKSGTSILGTPGLREYYHREALLMRDLGAFDLWLLKLNGRVIAFEYCQFAKGICLSQKISFDPDFDRFSPGKILRSTQLEQLHMDPEAKQLDTLGVLCDAKAKWTTQTYRSSRCFVAIGGHTTNFVLRATKSLKRIANKVKHLKVGAEGSLPPSQKPKPNAQEVTAQSTTQQPASPACAPPVCPTAFNLGPNTMPSNHQSCT